MTACSQDNNNHKLFEHPDYDFPYRLDDPGRSWILPNSLIEISGVSFIDNQRLACVQDEKGEIYIFNMTAGKVESEISFGEDGDYEGIEIIENDAWILQSDGTLHQVTDYLETAGPGLKKYKTALSARNDTEGLAYDPVSRNLLIACKGKPFTDERDGKKYKAIYSFSLETVQMGKEPFLLIHLDTVRYYRDYDALAGSGAKTVTIPYLQENDETFKPSGIAIHPLTGYIFILGSAGKLLMVISGRGEMLAMVKLSPKIFPQPEGICFSPDGKLYISNEGKGRAGTILEFAPGK